MPIYSRINQTLNIIIRTVTGDFTAVSIKAAFAESLAHPDFKENMDVIWDLTTANFGSMSADELIETVEYIRNNISNRGADYKIILVAPVDISFGISRMFKSYGDDLPVSIHIVKNLDEAYLTI